MEDRRRRAVLVLAGGAAGAYAWWAAGLRPFTWPPLIAVAVAGIATIVFGTRRRRPRQRPVVAVEGIVFWGFLLALLVGWELAAYFQHPRADHPTLSSLADPVIAWRPVRALAFLAWTAVGVDLSRR